MSNQDMPVWERRLREWPRDRIKPTIVGLSIDALLAELDLSRSCYQSALVSVGDCLAAAELLTTERNELAKECQRLDADLAAAREREPRLMAWVERVDNIFREYHTVRHTGRFDYCVRSTCVDARAALAAAPSAVAQEREQQAARLRAYAMALRGDLVEIDEYGTEDVDVYRHMRGTLDEDVAALAAAAPAAVAQEPRGEGV